MDKKAYTYSVAILLSVTGAAKIWSAFGDVIALGVPDPILGLEFRHLMFLMGLIEIAVAGCCLAAQPKTAIPVVALLSSNILVYRLVLWLIGWTRPCGCLGSLTERIHLSPNTADAIMKIVLAYLVIGSYALLVQQWFCRMKIIRPA